MTTGTQITLTLTELLYAANTGTVRHYESYKGGFKHSAGFNASFKNPLSMDIEGACGEIAVAKALGVYYDAPVNTFKSPDIGKKYQVRSSTNHTNRLIVRPNDKDDEIFIFVTSSSPVFWVRGWMRGSDAKQEKYWEHYMERPPAWFVPVKDLKTMESLKDE